MLRAQPINCTLKSNASSESSTDMMIGLLAMAFDKCDVAVAETIRIAAHNVPPGVTSDCPSSKHLAQVWRGVNGERASSGVGF